MYTTFSSDIKQDNQDKQEQTQNKEHSLKVLSYYQSTLRNAGMFTTLALATFAAAHSHTISRNPWGGYARYAASLLFLGVALFVSFRLLDLREKNKHLNDPLGAWQPATFSMLIADLVILVSIVLSFINKMILKH